MRNAKLLIINTAVLTFGNFLMRTISVSFNVYLSSQIGLAGIGLLQLILAVYGLAVTFAGAGVRLGSTRLITDTINTTDGSMKSTMNLCIRYALSFGVSVCLIMYIFSEIISKKYIYDERSALSLKVLALSLPPISVSSALSGYFTAKKTMIKYSAVQLAEQAVKIVVTVTALRVFAGSGLEKACCAIAVGITFSETVSALSSYLIYRITDKSCIKSNRNKNNLKKLLHICVPDVIGSGFRSVLLTVEHLMIPQGFKKSGHSAEHAMSAYGTIHGIALPVVLYPSAVLTSLSTLLIPELARYRIQKNDEKTAFLSTTALRITMLFSVATASFMFFFSDIISNAIYGSSDSGFYIKLLSVLIPIMYSDMITDGLLKGLDRQAASMRYNIFDSSLCVILVYFLLPKFAIGGYIFILFISEIINFSLSIGKLSKITTLRINLINDIIKPLLCSIGCCAGVNIGCIYFGIFNYSSKTVLIILALICSLLYFCGIYLLNCITRCELNNYSSMLKSRGCA